MNQQLEKKLQTLPKEPGVYFHKSKSGEIIYVGKAAVLKSRVRQYFQKSRPFDPKTEALIAEIADTDWTTVETELDALQHFAPRRQKPDIYPYSNKERFSISHFHP